LFAEEHLDPIREIRCENAAHQFGAGTIVHQLVMTDYRSGSG
jgi:hypothetical protein